MKKVLMALSVAFACVAVSAQEAAPAPAANQVVTKAPATKASWPVWLAFNSAEDIDVVGVRFTLPYGKCEGVTGFDLGVYGSCRYFEGVQVNILRNEVKDIMAGCQVGVYNSAGRADCLGVQVGLFNEARTMRGVQVGIINLADSIYGVQVGLINRAETAYGFQVGGVNVIRESDLAFCPLINIGYDMLLPVF
ncbi:MAG: hypothetical protein MJ249_03225 [Kiritimatiellae bacterium]|nr:hypothetical protein [Kiritimatiellia bacterium]